MSPSPPIAESQDSPPPTPARRGPAPGRLALGLLLVLLGGAWLVEALDIVNVRWQTLLGAAVLGIGALLVATARRGDSDGLIGLGVVLSVVLVITTSLPVVPITGGLGDRDHRPSSIEELEATYELGAGNLVIDLRRLDLPRGVTEVSAHLGAGELVVRVPEGVGVDVQASTGAGELNVLGRRQSGIGPSLSTSVSGGRQQLSLDLSVGLGSVEVTR